MSVARMSLRPGFAGPSYVAEHYPLIRSVADPSIANLPTEDLEAELLRQGIRAEAMESFFGDIGNALGSAGKAIGNVVSSAAPVVAQVGGKALPGVISGAAAGCALGPWGCLGGALIGGVTSALTSGGGKPAAPSPGGVVGTIAGAVPTIAGAFGGGGGVVSGIASALPAIAGLVSGAAGGKPAPPASPTAPDVPAPPTGRDVPAAPTRRAVPAPPTAGSAPTNPAGVLLGLVQRPEVIQSLMSMALGSSGRKDVPVGDSSVPVSAFANLLSVLGSKAFGQSEAWAEPSESLPDYLYRDGELQADPADRSERAAVLLERLGEVAMVSPRPAPRFAFSQADEYYDELDAAELDLMEMEGGGYGFDE